MALPQAPQIADDETLSLYYFDGCPFCVKVQRVIDRLGLQVEPRHIWKDPQHRQDLQAARGRTTVPVLRVTTAEDDIWLPESSDIVRYLEQRFGSSP